MAVSCIDVISPAFQRMKRQLFQPFRFGQWIRFALVGFLSGEIGPGGGLNFQFPFNPPSQRREFLQIGPLGGRGSAFLLAIALVLMLAFILVIIFIYISSRMRFVLFDSVVAGECQIRRFWRGRGEPAFRLFVWRLLFLLCLIVSIGVLVGIPLLAAFALGLFRNPSQHIAVLILGGISLALVLLVVILGFAIVYVFTKDFVVPQMAYENASVGEGWRRLWSMMKAEKGAYAGYIGMKIILSIAALVVVGVAVVVMILVLLIPVGAIGLVVYLVLRNVALTWNPLTIALAAICVLIAAACLFLIVGLASAPAVVFFPAYSIYFFADRYAPLRTALFPQPPPPPAIQPTPI